MDSFSISSSEAPKDASPMSCGGRRLRRERLGPPLHGGLRGARALEGPPDTTRNAGTIWGFGDSPRMGDLSKIQRPSRYAGPLRRWGTLLGSIKGPGQLSAVLQEASRWQHRPWDSACCLWVFPEWAPAQPTRPTRPLFQDDVVSLKPPGPKRALSSFKGTQAGCWGRAARTASPQPPAPSP